MAADPFPHDPLIEGLLRDLRPVKPLPSPWRRAVAWLAVLAVAVAVLAALGDTAALRGRIAAAPTIGWAMLGSALTAILAAIAAFTISVPGRAAGWTLLPLPAGLLWIAASGLGCLGATPGDGAERASLRVALGECLPFLLLASLPLSVVLLTMLYRGFPPRPGHTAAMAGLAAAAAAATLLNFVHPFDVAAIDMLVHGLAVAGIVIATGRSGRHWLARAHAADGI